MISNNSYEALVCGLSDNKHFVKTPIVLTDCGHCACHDCLPDDISSESNCQLCKTKITRDLRNDKESIAINKWIDSSLDELLNDIKEKTIKQISKFKSCISSKQESMALQLSYIEEELDNKIESIKIDLDTLHEKLKKDLKNIKEEMINSQEILIHETERSLKDYETAFNVLNDSLIDVTNRNKEILYKYQNNLLYLHDWFDDFDKIKYELKFNVTNTKISEDLIGKLNFIKENDVYFCSSFLNQLKSDNYKKIKLNKLAWRSTKQNHFFYKAYTEGDLWFEKENGTIIFSFKEKYINENELILYDHSRKLYLRITNTSCYWGTQKNRINNKLYYGFWFDPQTERVESRSKIVWIKNDCNHYFFKCQDNMWNEKINNSVINKLIHIRENENEVILSDNNRKNFYKLTNTELYCGKSEKCIQEFIANGCWLKNNLFLH